MTKQPMGGAVAPPTPPHSLVPVIYFRGDLLLELRQLVLRKGAGQDLGPPLDEVVDHVTDAVKGLPLVPLEDGNRASV